MPDASSALPGPTPPSPDDQDAALTQRLRDALTAKGASYRPRTHHLLADGAPKYVNRLILETSPYLLQHAHNPVDWYPWGEEAFERARREGKPVFVSIGYSTCHWCHVMERESFEDEEVASVINANFVAIKVDREERPDVDDLYMKAVQVLTGRGGWPMTVMLTPDKAPFFGGTYFPARDGDRGARKGFVTILRELRGEYDKNRAGVVARAQQLSQRVEQLSTPSPPGDVPTAAVLEQVARGARASYDPMWGGFGRAPKFPRPVLLELLLRQHHRSGDGQLLAMVTHTLDQMARGGLYDQVGGGFHRYSTDAQWLVPHFEKMLYDNAQLVPVYLDAYQLTGDAAFAEVARDTLRYVGREMTAPGGAFTSATDADSPTPGGHEDEGYFFTWTPDELRELLGADAARVVAAWYGVTPGGNFEGRSILSTPRPEATVAAELGVDVPTLRSTLRTAREALYAARAQRPPPLRDDKILCAWNGLMISGFARAALVLGDRDAATRAATAARFVLASLRSPEGTLRRSYKEGHTRSDAFLDDYAFLIQGLLDLFEADGDGAWLDAALTLQATLDADFWDEAHGGYFSASARHERLLVRDKPSYDGAEPSGNAVAAMNLLRLAELTSDEAPKRRAERLFAAFAAELRSGPGASPKLLSALDFLLGDPLEVFVVSPAGGDPEALLAAFRSVYLPSRVLVVVQEGAALDALARRVPALEGKRALNGVPTAFVCQRGLCKRPTTDPVAFVAELKQAAAPKAPPEGAGQPPTRP